MTRTHGQQAVLRRRGCEAAGAQAGGRLAERPVGDSSRQARTAAQGCEHAERGGQARSKAGGPASVQRVRATPCSAARSCLGAIWSALVSEIGDPAPRNESARAAVSTACAAVARHTAALGVPGPDVSELHAIRAAQPDWCCEAACSA